MGIFVFPSSPAVCKQIFSAQTEAPVSGAAIRLSQNLDMRQIIQQQQIRQQQQNQKLQHEQRQRRKRLEILQ